MHSSQFNLQGQERSTSMTSPALTALTSSLPFLSPLTDLELKQTSFPWACDPASASMKETFVDHHPFHRSLYTVLTLTVLPTRKIQSDLSALSD